MTRVEELVESINIGDTLRAIMLLEMVEDVNALAYTKKNQTTPLIAAVKNNNIVIIDVLLKKGADVELYTERENSAVIEALKSRNAEILAMFEKCKPNVNQVPFDQVTLLMTCCHQKGSVSNIQWLLDMGADVNHKCRMGKTALIEAAESGRLDIVELLLKSGADPLLTDEHDVSDIFTEEFLQGMGADARSKIEPNIKKLQGETAMDYAAKEGHTDIAEFIKTYIK